MRDCWWSSRKKLHILKKLYKCYQVLYIQQTEQNAGSPFSWSMLGRRLRPVLLPQAIQTLFIYVILFLWLLRQQSPSPSASASPVGGASCKEEVGAHSMRFGPPQTFKAICKWNTDLQIRLTAEYIDTPARRFILYDWYERRLKVNAVKTLYPHPPPPTTLQYTLCWKNVTTRKVKWL